MLQKCRVNLILKYLTSKNTTYNFNKIEDGYSKIQLNNFRSNLAEINGKTTYPTTTS